MEPNSLLHRVCKVLHKSSYPLTYNTIAERVNHSMPEGKEFDDGSIKNILHSYSYRFIVHKLPCECCGTNVSWYSMSDDGKILYAELERDLLPDVQSDYNYMGLEVKVDD